MYGGFRFPVAKNLSGDVGVIRYLYPGANADSGFYQAADRGGLNPKKLAKTALLVSVGKTF